MSQTNYTSEEFENSDIPIFKSHQKNFILRPTPASEIYEKIVNGRSTKYVKGTYVKKVLNLMFGFNWSFTIRDKEVYKETKEVSITGRLEIPVYHPERGNYLIIKEQFGTSEMQSSLADSFKSASTDALKKCASELGLFSDVYNGEDFGKEAKLTPEQKYQTIKDLLKTLEALKIKIVPSDKVFLERILEEKEITSYDKAIAQLTKKLPKTS